MLSNAAALAAEPADTAAAAAAWQRTAAATAATFSAAFLHGLAQRAINNSVQSPSLSKWLVHHTGRCEILIH